MRDKHNRRILRAARRMRTRQTLRRKTPHPSSDRGFSYTYFIRETAEQLAAQDGVDAKYQEYALQLLQLTSTTSRSCVYMLLLRNPKVFLERDSHHDLLTAAAYTNHVSLETTLANAQVKINVGTFGNPFTAAVRSSNYHLLHNHITKSTQRGTWDHYMRLLKTAIKYAGPQMVKHLLRSGCTPLNRTSRCSSTQRDLRRQFETLLYTADVETFEVISTELRSRRLVTFDDRVLHRILDVVTRNGWAETTRHIILLGAPVNVLIQYGSKKETVLHFASKGGYAEVVKVLLDHGIKTYGSELTSAAMHGHASIIEILLARGVDPHTGATRHALYTAARKGFMNIVCILLDAGMDSSRGDPAPLVGAIEAEHTAMFRMLVQRGAVVSLALPEARLRAEAAGLESMLALLCEYELLEPTDRQDDAQTSAVASNC
ncbi:ankyrin repeat-containing domain protein [Massariosphaeria phaeospora]|uniref:Ankyrin repeat-containing domain protein n=1 Tax=Massariosphaeria phaeospora TaxID=100035 RepID=A0A7C8M4M2_9PLEO|nr:ankyrin repeat-containing domain protein [Massariosphaeria phaeospora]